jgi:alpha-beta hydrolase superfamily lysophospholipase
MRYLSHLTFAVLAASVTVTGCSYAPAQAVRMPEQPLAAPADVEHKDGTFEGVHGTKLYEQSWRPKGEPKAVVVIVHGLKDHSTRYKSLAERLAQQGFAVHAFDLRGHGRSEGVRVWVDEFDDYVGDLDMFVHRAQQAENGKPVLLFGHSMGGAIVTLYSITKKPKVEGIVLSAAALDTDVSAGGPKFVAALAPAAGVFNLDLKKFSRDPAVVSEGSADPLVYQGSAAARTAVELLGAIGRIQEHMGELSVPVLALHGEADTVTPPSGSKQLIERAQSKDKTLKLYPNLVHDLIHEPEKEQVIGDVVKWMNDHVPGGAAPAAAPPAAPSAPAATPPAASGPVNPPAPVKPPEGQKTPM